METIDKTARRAGLLYVAMGFTAPFSLIYIPMTLIVRGDAAATAKNILHSEMLFRAGMAMELIGVVFFVFLALTLYRLFSGVDKSYARAMAVLALMSVPVSFLNVVNELAALILLRGNEYLSVFNKPQREALAMLFVRLHGQGLMVNEAFWGLWLFPFGVLVMKSGFFPRILGVLLIINSIAYPVVTLTSLLLPAYAGVVDRWAFIPETGELWIMLWLLIKGAKAEPLPAPAVA